ncbi:MAG: MBL fold metallo-hydrolase [Actinomycetia bacterium]|nr:MBL fold metallo-hydrolase [Actinomycetes bacterium]
MKITLLGTGGPRPDPMRYGPATLVQASRLSLLFDAGRGAATQLARAGIRVEDLDAIFITHHHFDHIGGLADLIMAAWNNGRTVPLLVVGPLGTDTIIEGMLEHVYARDINFRIAEEWAHGRKLDHPSEMLDVRVIVSQRIDLPHGVEVTVGQVEHGSKGIELSLEEWSASAYRVSAEGRTVTISGDAVEGLELGVLAANSDALVMCAYLAKDEIVTPEERFLTDKVIAGAPQAAAIATEANVALLILTHIREKSDEETERMRSEVTAVFPGEVIVGYDLLVVDIP